MKTASNRTARNSLYTPILYAYIYRRMRTPRSKIGVFQKVGECLYRYPSSGVYYARIKVDGKEIRQSLRTTDREIAKRALADFKERQRGVDHSKGKTTLAELCDQYGSTLKQQKEKTVEGKELILRRLKSDWPTGSGTQVRKIKPSDVRAWLGRYDFGRVSYNKHLRVIKEIMRRAVQDGIIIESPAEKIKAEKLAKPIRKAPSFEEFKAIVASIREQKFSDTAEESADFVEFLGLSGLGLAEAQALRWDDIDWRNNRIVTFRHKTESGFAIPLFHQLRPLLERRFANRNGREEVFSVKKAAKAIAGACKRLNLPNYTHICFRRMFITRALERGVDVKTLAEWQGHKDGGKLILGTYSHVRADHSERMAQLMTDSEPENVVPMPKAGAA